MPADISSWAIIEKNKVSQGNVWLTLLEITIPGEASLVRITDNTENVTWNSQLWQSFPVEVDDIGDNAKGEIPRLDIRVSNVNQVMEYYLDQYDLYLKANGYTPITVRILVVNSGNLSNLTPESEYFFELQQPKYDAHWATFTLGASNPYRKREPASRILKNQCQHATFGGIECGHVIVGAETCDRTLVTCRTYGNSQRFGGFPGAGDGAITI